MANSSSSIGGTWCWTEGCVQAHSVPTHDSAHLLPAAQSRSAAQWPESGAKPDTWLPTRSCTQPGKTVGSHGTSPRRRRRSWRLSPCWGREVGQAAHHHQPHLRTLLQMPTEAVPASRAAGSIAWLNRGWNSHVQCVRVRAERAGHLPHLLGLAASWGVGQGSLPASRHPSAAMPMRLSPSAIAPPTVLKSWGFPHPSYPCVAQSYHHWTELRDTS